MAKCEFDNKRLNNDGTCSNPKCISYYYNEVLDEVKKEETEKEEDKENEEGIVEITPFNK